MTKNLKQNMIDFRGILLAELDEEQKTIPILLSTVVINCLLREEDPSDMRLPGVEKLKRFNLAQKIFNNPEEVELTEEELKLIKDQIDKYAPIIVTGVAHKMLEG